ncbi:MAG: hypothetical protein ACI9HK_002334 [Pirellulaceae bacterium]|jgi:hypothetical protein
MESRFTEMLAMLVAWSGLGLPVGVPPQPEDPLLSRVAPAECIYYGSWSAMATADPESANHTEQLIAEEEIQQAVQQLREVLQGKIRELARNENDPAASVMAQTLPDLGEILLTHTAAIYLSKFEMGDEGPDVRGAAIIKVGDDLDKVQRHIGRLHQHFMGGAPEALPGRDGFYRLQTPPNVPKVEWGFRGQYLIIGVGEGAIDEVYENAKTDAPQWFLNIGTKFPVERRSSVGYVNIGQILEKFKTLAGPDVAKNINGLGLENLTELVSVTGLDGEGFVNKMHVGVDGKASGILSLIDAAPLGKDDLRHIPADAILAFAQRLDAGKLLETVVETLDQLDPNQGDELLRGLDEIRDEIGIDIRQDLLKAVGDVWTLHAAPDAGGIITGWTASVTVRDRTKLAILHGRLTQLLEQEGGRRGPTVVESKLGDNTIYTLHVDDEQFFVAPSWTITGDRLIVGLFPQAIKAQLGRKADAPSLADRPEVARMFDAESGPLAISFQDTRKLFEVVYPFAQIGLKAMLTEMRLPPQLGIHTGLLPSAGAVAKHLRPQVAASRRTAEGIEFHSEQTLPGNNGITAAPVMVALLLPAVQSARSSARRMQSMNNLKQLALAFHNFHDTFRGIPPRASVDKDGKPLLSWRVHLLPFLEQQNLYEQFKLDEPWDSEHNKKLIPLMPQLLVSPQSTNAATSGMTNYLAIDMKNSIWDVAKEGNKPVNSFAAVLDGLSNTAMLVEADDSAAVIWTKPDDYKVDENNATKGLGGMFQNIFLMAMCDGSVRAVTTTVDKQVLLRVFDRQDGNPVPDF